MADYLRRLVNPLIGSLIAELPALSLVGPRASGKTTTARAYAESVIRLDVPGVADVFRSDPNAALRDLREPVLLDEWQEAPEILGAVKRAVNTDARPGRFILTGSVRAELDSHSWPGTGRIIHVPMTGLTIRERQGAADRRPFIDRVADGTVGELRLPGQKPDLRDYVNLALKSGFPEPALRLSHSTRRHWLNSYVQQLVGRDALSLEPRRDPERLRRYVEALALSTAGVVELTTLLQSADVNRRTAQGYESLLTSLFVLEVVPAWFTNRLKRLVRTPKRYLVDPALAAAVVNADADAVIQDSDLRGRLIDTFVVAQLRAELPVSELQPRIHHLRQQDGRREIDILIELSGHRVIAIEVKASGTPDRTASRHLTWLRDELGERFVHGLVLHTGQFAQDVDDRITTMPICALWG